VQLESDDLNVHECMAALCGVINHMVDKGISPAPEQESKDAALPPWMESIQKCLTDSKHPNVRLFLLKLILNVEPKFRPYAHHFVNPVLKVRCMETPIFKENSWQFYHLIQILKAFIKFIFFQQSDFLNLILS